MKASTETMPISLTAQPEISPIPERTEASAGSSMLNVISAAAGDATARRRAQELDEALGVLSRFDEGPDLVLYYKHLMGRAGAEGYTLHFNETDALSPSQRGFADAQFDQFRTWYGMWSAQGGVVAECR